VWWSKSLIPATWEVEIEGSWVKAGQGKIGRLYLKNKLKAKGLGEVQV
jgi:hypothetical protein